MKIQITQLQDMMQKVLMTKYYSAEQAREISEVLLYAEMVGKNTQGIVKLLGADPIQNVIPHHEIRVLKETKLSTLIDGGRNPGILVSKIATKKAIDKCNKNGFAIIGTNNTYSSTGAIGYYANEIVKNDFIGIVMSGSPKGVAPYGSIDPIFGTNPIAFGFPTQGDPLIFDMATAAFTWYGLIRSKVLGIELPDGVAIDHDGNATRDPEKAMQGAILPFDNSYKSSGLSMMIELFTGALVGEIAPDEKNNWYCGNLFIAIDPDLLIGRTQLKKYSSLLINEIKNSRPDKKSQNILVPGERGKIAKRKVERSKRLEIENNVLNELFYLLNN